VHLSVNARRSSMEFQARTRARLLAGPATARPDIAGILCALPLRLVCTRYRIACGCKQPPLRALPLYAWLLGAEPPRRVGLQSVQVLMHVPSPQAHGCPLATMPAMASCVPLRCLRNYENSYIALYATLAPMANTAARTSALLTVDIGIDIAWRRTANCSSSVAAGCSTTSRRCTTWAR
jgi:hypothetical protein